MAEEIEKLIHQISQLMERSLDLARETQRLTSEGKAIAADIELLKEKVGAIKKHR